MKVFSKILIANRGEIAVRIIRSLKKMAIASVVVYVEKDRDSDFVIMADEKYLLEGNSLSETYLNAAAIVDIALQSGANAVHPGYGFLSENADFSRMVVDAGLSFIGPSFETIALMGNKKKARELVESINVPVVPGFQGEINEILSQIKENDYPLIIKASAGGGGKGMRIVHSSKDLNENIKVASREAKNYFGQEELILEHYFMNARHIEVQIMGDMYGKIMIIGERDCSLQRRHQKLLEESPAGILSMSARQKLYQYSRKIAEKIKYQNAGTIEFLMDKQENFYFLEMNTRIQVEHPVTELVSGMDLVKQQILISAGDKLSISDEDLVISGHSVELRLYAEDPENDFLPSPGFISDYFLPDEIRVDSAISGPSYISSDYDPLIAKIISHGKNREEALSKLKNALIKSRLTGIKTNREFLMNLIQDEDVVSNDISTQWLENNLSRLNENLKKKRLFQNKHSLLMAFLFDSMNVDNRTEGDPWLFIGSWNIQNQRQLVLDDEIYLIEDLVYEQGMLSFNVESEHVEAFFVSIKNGIIEFIMKDKHYAIGLFHDGKGMSYLQLNGFEFIFNEKKLNDEIPDLSSASVMTRFDSFIVRSPMPGKIANISVLENESVKKGQLLFTLDAMKIENKILSPVSGCISGVLAKEGDQLRMNQEVIYIEEC